MITCRSARTNFIGSSSYLMNKLLATLACCVFRKSSPHRSRTSVESEFQNLENGLFKDALMGVRIAPGSMILTRKPY